MVNRLVNRVLVDWNTFKGVHQVQGAMQENAMKKAEPPGVEVHNNTTTMVSPVLPIGENWTVEELAAKNGVDLTKNEVYDTKMNHWMMGAVVNGEPIDHHLYQVTYKLRPIVGSVAGFDRAVVSGPRYAKGATQPLTGKKYSLVVIPDQQIKGSMSGLDYQLHELILAYLEEEKPSSLVLSGDVLDFPTIAKYRPFPDDFRLTLKDGIDETYRVVREYVEACGKGLRDKRFVPGNHEQRLQNYIIDKAPHLFGLRRAGEDEAKPSLVSVEWLLRLDELGFAYVGGNVNDWPLAETVITPRLAVRHGWKALGKSGATAMNMLDVLGYSVIVGHTHRQGLVFKSPPSIKDKDKPEILYGIEAGTTCNPQQQLYTPIHNWQRGFVQVDVFEDGSFNPNLFTYDGTALTGKGRRYYHRRGSVVRG